MFCRKHTLELTNQCVFRVESGSSFTVVCGYSALGTISSTTCQTKYTKDVGIVCACVCVLCKCIRISLCVLRCMFACVCVFICVCA